MVSAFFIALGVGAFSGILMMLGMKPDDLLSLADHLTIPSNVNGIRWALALNHFISFILCALFLGWIYSGKKFTQYAPISLPINIELLFKFLLLLLLCYPLAGLLGYFTKELSLPVWMDQMDDQNAAALKMLLNMNGIGELLLNIFIIAIIPAIGEEMLFRGVVQNELQKGMQHRYWPLIITSFLFAAFHMEISGLLPKMIIGLVLGYSYLLTRNLLYPMILHLINNAVQVVMVFFTGTEQLSEESPALSLTQMAMILLTIPIIFWYLKYLNHNEDGSST